MKYLLGIETTAHTFGAAVLDWEGKILSNVKDTYTTEEGGMIPMEVRKHHKECAPVVYKKALEEAGVKEEQIEVIAFSNAPGLAPCLIEGMSFVKELATKLDVPVVRVNHCVAHLEIGETEGATDPVLLYASGANTQIIAYEAGKYRVFGETLDIGVGNFIDTFARYIGLGFPGGPKIMKLAEKSGKKGKVVFMHGKDKTPKSAWYPWFGKEVEKKDVEFVAPELPKNEDPVLEEWLKELDKTNPGENDILVGHSRGGMAIMRWLERLPKEKRVGKVVLLAANNPEVEEKNKKKETHGFYEEGPYDFDKIKSHCDTFVIIHSKEDPWVSFNSGQANAEGLKAKFKMYEGKSHFGKNLKEVPELLEEISFEGNLIELPYSIKGMDVAFSGLQTKLKQLYDKGETAEDLSYSMQETVFAMLIEASERALAHTGKKELVLGGGVACNNRLQDMAKKMCAERGVKYFCPPIPLLVDNAAMIGYLGLKMFKAGLGTKDLDSVDIDPRERTDDVEVTWK